MCVCVDVSVQGQKVVKEAALNLILKSVYSTPHIIKRLERLAVEPLYILCTELLRIIYRMMMKEG